MGIPTDKKHATYRYNILNTLILALFIFFFMIINSWSVNGATIHGSVYDVLLNPEANVRIDIDTQPHQFLISKNGNYSIDLPVGNYSLIAYNVDGSSEENINITDPNGDYIIDIVLEPTLSRPIDIDMNFTEPSIDIPADSNPTIPTNVQSNATTSIIIIILVSVGLIYLLYIFIRSHGKYENAKNKSLPDDKISIKAKEPESADISYEDEYGKSILKKIKDQGRITQKELRKNIPLSEGKISLIITELEHNGKIKKIKKGRGNILVFIKD
jgi:uncharacterized membrane protein